MPAAIGDSLCSHDDAGAEPRLDWIAFEGKTRELDLLEILEVRPFHRENELFQLLAPTGNSTAGTPCDSSSSEHLLPPGFVVADSHLAAGTAAFVSIS